MAPTSGEGGVWDVPPGSGALPQLLLALLHCCHSEKVLRTGLCRDYPTDYGELWPLALLLLLLLPTASAHLHPSSVFRASLPSSWHSGTGSPLLSTGRQEQACSWGLAWVVSCLPCSSQSQRTSSRSMVGQMAGSSSWLWCTSPESASVPHTFPSASSLENSTYASKVYSSDLPCPGSGSCLHPLVWCVSNPQEFRYGLEGGCTDDSLLWAAPQGCRRNFPSAFKITSLLKWEEESELSVSRRNLLENSAPTKLQPTSHSLSNKLSISSLRKVGEGRRGHPVPGRPLD